MNFQPMPAPVYSSAAQMIQEARERRRRLMGSQTRQAALTPAPKPVEHVPADPIPHRARRYDAHVQHWRMWKARNGSPMRTFLLDYCAQKGWPIDWIVSKSRTYAVAHARQEMAYMLKKQFDASFPAIGRILGGIDHTTVMHGIKRHQDRMNNPLPLTKLKLAPVGTLPKSGHPGVTWANHGECWEVRFKIDGKTTHFGRYKDLDEAIRVARKAVGLNVERGDDGQDT